MTCLKCHIFKVKGQRLKIVLPSVYIHRIHLCAKFREDRVKTVEVIAPKLQMLGGSLKRAVQNQNSFALQGRSCNNKLFPDVTYDSYSESIP